MRMFFSFSMDAPIEKKPDQTNPTKQKKPHNLHNQTIVDHNKTYKRQMCYKNYTKQFSGSFSICIISNTHLQRQNTAFS